ncbi:MAG TPA: glycosyltransferase [Blastocatellia bacterium]|nr:glycosyltransferase [Blastocatellia bacterium]
MRLPVEQLATEVRAGIGAGKSALSSSRIRVVRVIDRLNIGGPAKHVVWLTAGLSEDEFETTLITGTVPPGEGDMSYFARDSEVEPIVISEMSRELRALDILVIAKLVRQFLELKPQIIHTHKAKAGAAGRVAAMIYKWLTPSALWLRPRQCHIVHTYHGHVFHSYYGRLKTRLFIAIERVLAMLCTDRIVVVSEQQRREICESFRVGRLEQFRVVPLGIDFEELVEDRDALRREYGVSDDEVAIGSVGRLCEVKNHAMLIESAARLTEGCNGNGPRTRFVIVGDGHLRADIETQARDLGVADRTVFTGFREDATSLYAGLDIVALTSLNEGTPLTLIEAMCCGRPVVATEVGGVVDVMGSRRTSLDGFTVWDHGVTAPSRDVDAFARALRYLVERPDLRREMGERGRAFVRARLSRDRLVSDIEMLYRELIGGEARAAAGAARRIVSFSGKGNNS